MSESLRGQILVASCKLRDPSFFKTAVLLIEHGEEGAMGLVINRPSSITVAAALSGHFDLSGLDELVYVGGPVEPAALFILYGDSGTWPDDDEETIVPGVMVANSTDAFQRILEDAASEHLEHRYRIFSGCAGWSPGQLEHELARGDWLTVPARPEQVFHDDPYIIWDELLHEAYRSNRLFPLTCEHPEWN